MPYDAKTGKEYPYTEEGMEQYKKETGGGMPMKNMSYWKAKNTLPGINPGLGSGQNLGDGRSPSSAFQFNPVVRKFAGKAASSVSDETKEKATATAKAWKHAGNKATEATQKDPTPPRYKKSTAKGGKRVKKSGSGRKP